jgi:hypothetical protein
MASRTNETHTKRFHTWYWMNDKWPMIAEGRSMKWLLEKFLPMSGWPADWEQQKVKYEQANPEVYSNFEVFDPDGNDAMPYE